MKDYLHFEINPPPSPPSLLRRKKRFSYFRGRILVFYTKFYFKKSCVIDDYLKTKKKPQKTDAFFSKEVASLQILFSSTNGVLQINSSMHRWKAIKFSKNPKAVKYFVYVLSIIPRTARASEGLNIYITSRLLHIIELDTAKLRTKLLYRFIFSSNENPRL